MEVDRTVRGRPLERAGRAAARYRAKRDDIEPFVRLLVDIAALTSLLRRRGPTVGPPARAED